MIQLRYICYIIVIVVTKLIPVKTFVSSVFSLLFLVAGAAVAKPHESEEKLSHDHVKVSPVPAKVEEPVLPRNLLKPGESAEIVICAAIDEKGKLVNARTVSATHEELEKVVIASLKKWEFRPAMRDGKPVKSRVDIPFKFVVAKNPG